MYDLTELLEGMRGVYLRSLTAAFDDLRGKGVRYFAEAVMQDGGDLRREGPLSLPFRCDALVVSTDGKSVTPTLFAAERRWNFSPVEFEGEGLTIALASCHWESTKLTISGDPDRIASVVKGWFELAFMPAEVRDEGYIQEVVHDVSEYASEGQLTTCIVDFGTLPVTRVLALFDQLRLARVTRVELSMP
jgi:hypothetical protein